MDIIKGSNVYGHGHLKYLKHLTVEQFKVVYITFCTQNLWLKHVQYNVSFLLFIACNGSSFM